MTTTRLGRRAAVLLLVAACAPHPEPDPPVVVVERVVPGHAAHRAGVREGDELAVASLPELADLARRSAAGQDVRLACRRPSRDELSLPRADWGLEARPPLVPSDETAHRAARQALADGRHGVAERRWSRLAAGRVAAGDAGGAAFFHLRRGEALLRDRRIEEARAAARDALQAARAGGATLEAWTEESWGNLLGRANEFALADEAYQGALARVPEMDVTWRAALLQKRAIAFFRRSRYEDSAGLAREALAGWERTAPASHALAETLLTLARVERNFSRHDSAVRLIERALSAARAVDPGGPAEAVALQEHAVIADRLGRLVEQERWLREALDIIERLGLRDVDAGRIYMGLATVAERTGDLAGAEAHLRAALDIFEGDSPGSVQVGWALVNLGHVLKVRGDLENAEAAFRRSVVIRAALVPGTWDHAVSLEGLGSLALARNRPHDAEEAFREALAMFERMAGETYGRAIELMNLAEAVAAQGRTDEARTLLVRAVALHSARAPGSLEEAAGLYILGGIERRAGRTAAAEAAYRRALALRSRLAPGSAVEAEALYAVGVLERRRGRREQAVGTLRLAVVALEGQRARLGGTPEDRARFGAIYAHIHKELLDLLLELGREEDAFDLLERYRVGSLGALLAQRDLRASARSKPAALADPRPPDLAQAARLLGEGTLLLSFAVLADRTVVFALPGGDAGPSLGVHAVPMAEVRLRQEVEVVRDLLQSPRAPAEGRAALRRRLRALYDALLGPAHRLVERSRRLLILPDGPLHLLPFGALVSGEAGSARHVLEDRPLSRAQALTLLAPPASAGGAGAIRLLAFGAPPPSTDQAPLPQARAEVESLGRLYAGEARVFVGAEASEGRAKALAGDARCVHFACHGTTDDRFPLDSYLALGPSADGAVREDGRLQAWEVCEQMGLTADLVVLSSCDTALGAELAGAGLLGLTFAFQYAGAHSVVASLWPVSDRSTASLMGLFHERLRRGEAPAQALRQAQLQVKASPLPAEHGLAGGLRRLFGRPGPGDLSSDASHPYYWAAFQLISDRP